MNEFPEDAYVKRKDVVYNYNYCDIKNTIYAAFWGTISSVWPKWLHCCSTEQKASLF